ncbi:MAG: hypothetical protein ABL958_21265, partial [Bdellovibrionia bacterium]
MGKAFVVVALSAVLLSGCQKSGTVSASLPEPPFCTTNQSFSNGTTVTGRALYQRRLNIATMPGGLGDTDPTNYPIRYAEVAVIQPGFGFMACGNTDSSGNFSLVVPNAGVPYTVIIHSRGKNDFVNASVLNNPESNTPFTIRADFVGKDSPNTGDIIA